MSKKPTDQLEQSAIALGQQHSEVVRLEGELAEAGRAKDRAAAEQEDALSDEAGEKARDAFWRAKWGMNATRAELGKAKAREAEMQAEHNELERSIDLAEIESINKSMFGEMLDRAVEFERAATTHLAAVDKLAVRRMALCAKHANGKRVCNPFDQFRLARAVALQQKPMAELAKAALEILGFGGPAFDWEEKALLPPAEAIVDAAIRGDDSILVAVKAQVAASRAAQRAERAAKVEAAWLEVLEGMDEEYRPVFNRYWRGLNPAAQLDCKEHLYRHSKDLNERRMLLREKFSFTGGGIASDEMRNSHWLAKPRQQPMGAAVSPSDMRRSATGLFGG